MKHEQTLINFKKAQGHVGKIVKMIVGEGLKPSPTE